MALKATRTCLTEQSGRREIDIKRYAKVEKVPEGTLEESCVLYGIKMFYIIECKGEFKTYIVIKL